MSSSPSKQDLVLTNLRNQVKSHAFEIKELKREVDLTRDQLDACEKELAKEIESRAALDNLLLEKEASFNELKHKLKTLRDEKRAVEAELAKTSAEADRLNASLQSKGGSISSEERSEMVRLHDRISQYRREVESLKKENETLSGIIKAKDQVIEESQAAVAEAMEANASKRKDLNVILDLKRQLKEMNERLGGEENQNRLADSENEHYRRLIQRKDEEIETLLDQIESQKSEVLDARKQQMAADVLMAEATAKMAESVEISEKARKAEADRVASGGFVPKDVHDAVAADANACREIIRSYEKDSRDSTVLAYRAARATAEARLTREVAQGLKAKLHLAKAIGEYDYTLLFNEPPPTEAQLAAADTRVDEAVTEEDLVSFQKALEEREQEIRSIRDSNEKERQALAAKAAEKELEVEALRERVESMVHQASAAEVVADGRMQVEKRSVGTSTSVSDHVPSVSDIAKEDKPLAATSVMAGETVQTALSGDSAPAPSSAGVGAHSTPAEALERSPTTEKDSAPAVGSTSRPVGVSSEALASIVRSLVASEQSKLNKRNDHDDSDREDVHGGYSKDSYEQEDEDLYRNAIAMLQEELAKLTDQMMSETDVAARIRQQVGDWKTAQLSAKQTAELLDSYNQMSMKLAAQTAVMTQRQEAYERAQRNEMILTNQIADLRMEIRKMKGKSPLRSVKKAFSSTVKGIKQSIASPAPKAVTTTSPLSDSATVLE